jgi:signal transduction histidine kinase
VAGQLKEPPDALIETASRHLGRMVTLTEQLLDATRLEAGREVLVREPVPVELLVRDGLELVGAQAREKGVAIEAAVPPALAVSGDRLKLEQVIVNLLANAVKFTRPGGSVSIEAAAEPDAVLLRVRDTGAGIRREHLEAVFEPFYQILPGDAPPAGDRRARPTRGAGLGLAIARQIVTLHGGRIWAESEGPGRGAVFTVRLPRHAAGAQAA